MTTVSKYTADVVFVSNHFDVHGSVTTGSGRILDVLNDQTTRFLKLDDARVCPRMSTTVIAQLRSCVMAKDSIQLVRLVGEDRPNEAKVFFAAQARKTIDVVLTLPTILVEGRIHVKSAHDPQAYLTLEAGAFFPVTSARFHEDAPDATSQVHAVILVNKHFVSSLAFQSN
jgi:hypothetical protein